MITGDVAVTRWVSALDIIEHKLRRRDESNLRLPAIGQLALRRPVEGHAADAADHSWDSLIMFSKRYMNDPFRLHVVHLDIWHLDVHASNPLRSNRSPVAAAALLINSCFRSDSNIHKVTLRDKNVAAQEIWQQLQSHNSNDSRPLEEIAVTRMPRILESVEKSGLILPNYHTHLTDARR